MTRSWSGISLLKQDDFLQRELEKMLVLVDALRIFKLKYQDFKGKCIAGILSLSLHTTVSLMCITGFEWSKESYSSIMLSFTRTVSKNLSQWGHIVSCSAS